MSEIGTPIVAGARYNDANDEPIRVKSVWVDEDLTTQIQIYHEDEILRNPATRTVSLDEFTSRLGESITRINTDHEAWEWRQKA